LHGDEKDERDIGRCPPINKQSRDCNLGDRPQLFPHIEYGVIGEAEICLFERQ
jgi:hypothetical protein